MIWMLSREHGTEDRRIWWHRTIPKAQGLGRNLESIVGTYTPFTAQRRLGEGELLSRGGERNRWRRSLLGSKCCMCHGIVWRRSAGVWTITHLPLRTILLLIFVGAMVLRLALMFLFATYRIDPAHDHWAFGAELGRVALSVASGSGFASPIIIGSGPTAWFTPIFPLMLAAVFKIFGVYTAQSAIAIYTVNSLFSAFTSVLLYWIAKPVFGPGVGLASAVLFALYPTSIWHSINTIWNTSLLAFAIVILIGLLMRGMSNTSYKLTLSAGLVMGLALLIDPAPAFFYPFALALYFWAQKGRPHAIRNVATLILLPVLVFGPWMLRNYLVLGAFTPRCCPGVEMRMGNNETAWRLETSIRIGAMHPTGSEAELTRYLQMGEVAYNRYCMEQAKLFIKENPGKFLQLTGWRFLGWWAGELTPGQGSLHTGNLILLKRMEPLLPIPFFLVGAISVWQKRSAWMILLLLITYPVPYYFVHVTQRYRFPIEPFLVLLGAQGLFVTRRWLDSLRSQPEVDNRIMHAT